MNVNIEHKKKSMMSTSAFLCKRERQRDWEGWDDFSAKKDKQAQALGLHDNMMPVNGCMNETRFLC